MAKKNQSKDFPSTVLADGVPVHCAHDVLVAVGELRPHPHNPNTHSPRQIALLATIIQTTGWRRPITVSQHSGYITAGHGRLLAAQHAGLTVAPVDHQSYADDGEELADVLADNRIAELAEFDVAQLRADLSILADLHVDLALAGFDEEALAQLAAPPPVTEDDFLGDDFRLPDGTIAEREAMEKVTIFVSRERRRDLMGRLVDLAAEFGAAHLRVVR